MTSPLVALDNLIAPIIVGANIARQVRDSLPQPMWRLVPAELRDAMDAVFAAAEAYDRRVGQLMDAGLFPRPSPPG